MSDFDDRLRALDPAAGQPYRLPDLEGMITRITSQGVAAPSHVWRRFQVKMASALAASALVTVGAVAALQGAGTVLPLLALQSARHVAAPDSLKAIYGTMEIRLKYHFTASPELTPTTPVGLSYALIIPSDVSTEALRIAAVFGVTTTPLTISGSNNSQTITDSSGRSLDYERSGLPQWYYSSTSPPVAPATASDTSNAVLPSHATLESDVRSVLTKLNYGYSVSSPNFSTATISTTSAGSSTPVSINTESVTYTVDVNNVATDQSIDFSVDANNNVVYASGPAFSVASTSTYPLQSPAQGVAALNAEQQSGPLSNAGASSTTSASPANPPIVDVSVMSVSLSLATYQLTDGATWLLPVYDYVGETTNANGISSNSNWYELAVDPSYVQVSSNSSGIGTGGPLIY
ncbi:MAG TPA: hypothetical protein VNF08_04510 [Acidimicrobiales bacterium]|nr:hypothetical protein [Acidimicrobiales bacterium]